MPPILTRPGSRDYRGVVAALKLSQLGIDSLTNGYIGVIFYRNALSGRLI